MCHYRSYLISFIFIFILVFICVNLSFSQVLSTPDDSNPTDTKSNLSDESKGIFPVENADEGDLFSEENLSSNDNNFFTMIILLFVLILAIYLIIKWVSKKRNITFTGADFAKIEGTKVLALNKYLQLLNIGGKYYLFGIGDGVNLISEINDKEQLDIIKLDLAKSGPFKPFVEQLKSSFKNFVGLKSKNVSQNHFNKNSLGGSYSVENNQDEMKKISNLNKNNKNNKTKQEKSLTSNDEITDTISENANRLLHNYEKINEVKSEKSYTINENLKNLYEIQDNTEKMDNYNNTISNTNVNTKSENTKPEKKVEEDILDDNNFEFIKKQRERLANLGINIKIDSQES